MPDLNAISALAMLSIAAYYDLKERSIHDFLWIAFGSLGVLMQVVQGLPSTFVIVSVFITTGIAILALFLKLFGTADAIAIIVLAIILPMYDGLILPLAVLVGASLISFFFTCSLNAFMNLRILIKRGTIFSDFTEPRHRKIIAFFLVHRRMRKERFAFPAECKNYGERTFKFFTKADEDFTQEDSYVTTALPLTFFMLVSLVFILFLPLSWSDLFAL